MVMWWWNVKSVEVERAKQNWECLPTAGSLYLKNLLKIETVFPIHTYISIYVRDPTVKESTK